MQERPYCVFFNPRPVKGATHCLRPKFQYESERIDGGRTGDAGARTA